MKKILFISCSSLIILTKSIVGLELGNLAMFGTGLGTGIALHETGHAVTAMSLGMKVKKFRFTRVDLDFSDIPKEERSSKMRVVSLAGYVTQGIASEIILQNKKWHTNDFAIGIMSLGVLNNLNNVYLYYIKKDYDNDLGIYKYNGGDPLIPSIIMVAHSTLVLYRMFSNTEIPNHFIGNTLGMQIKF